ncbi:F-box/kelch-repeat protein [Capsicum baccatum]|uniref:F-box/kelch-repeat protein n=1 Tax=Capsicum baccatum TaxID=33114 RepID=A0A2G2VLS2_CAPBA|nr:F-box/kelch-repeat protein [Capsicum baccatum]
MWRSNVVVEHWVYFSYQQPKWETFDPATLCWMHLPRMTPNDYFVFSDKESLVIGMKLLVFGKDVCPCNLSVQLTDKNSILATSAVLPFVAVVNNQFTLLTMLKCPLGSMKSITKNGFIKVNLWVSSEGPQEWNMLSQKQSGKNKIEIVDGRYPKSQFYESVHDQWEDVARPVPSVELPGSLLKEGIGGTLIF